MVTPQRPVGRISSQQSVARSVVKAAPGGTLAVNREDHLPDAGIERRHVAERTGFTGSDQKGVDKVCALTVTAGIANGDHLGVGGRVTILIHLVHTAAQDLAPMIGHHGGKRNSTLLNPPGRKRDGLRDKLIEQGLVDCCVHQLPTFLKTKPGEVTSF